jgi:hypothetical protein
MTSKSLGKSSTKAIQTKVLQQPLAKQVSLELPPPNERTLFEKIRAIFLNSKTIFLARFQVLVGFISAAVAGMNLSPLLALGVDTGFTTKQVYYLGGITVISGIATELARRVNGPGLIK